MSVMTDRERQKHLRKKIDCINKELNKCLRASNMGFLKRRKFLTTLKRKLEVHLLRTWYPDDPALGAKDKTFTLRPMHWTIDQAGRAANISAVRLENYFFLIESFDIHPSVGLVKFYNTPAKIIYDDEKLMNTFDANKMEKGERKIYNPLRRNKERLYVGPMGNNPDDNGNALKVSTALEKMHQNRLELCNVCKHINTRKIVDVIREEASNELAKTTIRKVNDETKFIPETNLYLIPSNNVKKNVEIIPGGNSSRYDCGYETIGVPSVQVVEEKIQGGQRNKMPSYQESTLI